MSEKIYCENCKNPVDAHWAFCEGCGTPLNNQLTLSLLDDEVFSLTNSGDISGVLNKTFIVPEGHGGIVTQKDETEKVLDSGKQRIAGLFTEPSGIEIYLFESKPEELVTRVSKLTTIDPLFVTVEIGVNVSVGDPLAFFRFARKSGTIYRKSNLASLLYVFIERSLSKQLLSIPIKELRDGNDGARDLISTVESDIDTSCREIGLKIDALFLRAIECDLFDRIQEKRVAYALSTHLEQAKLEGEKLLFDVYSDVQIQNLAQETSEIAHHEQKTAVWERLRNVLNSETRAATESKADLENILRDADRDRIIGDHEFSSFVDSLEHDNIVLEGRREFLLNRLGAERDFEMEMLQLKSKHGVEEERIRLESRLAREEIEARLDLANRKSEFKIQEQERRQKSNLRIKELADQSQRSSRIDEARTMSRIADIDRDQDSKDISMAIGTYEQFKRVKRENEASIKDDELRFSERQINQELQSSERKLEMKLKESKARHQQELERIDALSKVGIDTLIAVSGEENAKLLAELARTRALADLPPEKILAMNAEKSPEIAGALKEILTSAASNNQLEMYERLLKQAQDASSATQQQNRETIEMMGQLFDKALTGVKDVAVGYVDRGSR